VDAGVLGVISETALTREMDIKLNEKGIPSTFVPGRNLLFFTLAAAVAYRTQCYHLVGGMCETDYSGYPDCRDNTLQSMQQTLCFGMDAPFKIHTPLMHIDKAATWNLAQQLGGQPLLDLIINETHTCYKGARGQRHDWGYGCGECPACTLRQKGFVQFCSRLNA
jgi:7-cyano-7-deazaguanine synthase